MAQSKIKNSLEPELRFKEFTDFWIKTKLSDIAEFHKGKGISKSDIIADGKLECIRYGELYTTYSELINIVVSRTNTPSNELILSEYNDVIIPASGETNIDIATASCVLKSGVALSGDLNIIRSKMDGVFISFYLNNKRKIDIARLAQGVSVVHLYSSQLKSLKLNLPSLPEQQKIASFLTSVDENIQLLTRKKELLENFKKGSMQQLFSQKLRFKDDTSTGLSAGNGKNFPDWEEKRLGDVCVCMDNLRRPLNDSERQSMKGTIPYWGANKVMDYVNDYLFDETIILLAEDGGNFNEYKTRQIANLSKGKCWVNNHTHVLKGKKNLSNEFLFYSLVHKNITGFISGGTRAKLNKSEMLKIPIGYPTFMEQQKIASFLSAIDEKIEAVNQQITQSQTFKKGLLQQMFV